ncbi:lycopene cyclase domain-containing protein [Mucilaginibacter terrae]|uniref:Lycopene cyclase domain-containing protein n=1 Tax=Mucilaginibacter terrae TaxID=1955052 RepID=A0ABU3GWV0_9SPHI|nr:lycopene cyclase domain-containing protein [Mucilaginibacter terrae]MDT3404237.1 lycopene cyclase domain-containing protein [Mucilaginibacter terrae]
MKYAYLLINFLTVIFPVLLSFDKRVAFHKSWKFIWPGMAITGLVFLFWDVLFTLKGVWSFNDNYIVGIRFWGLPLEEVLFFLTVPFSCIFIYACLNYYIKWQFPAGISKWISNLMILLSMVMLAMYFDRLYTTVTFGLLLVMIFAVQYVLKSVWLPRFYMAYIVSLLPFYIVNGILTSVPIVLYNNAENIGRRVGTIPFEDHFYSLTLLLMNVAFFEYFKNKRSLAA